MTDLRGTTPFRSDRSTQARPFVGPTGLPRGNKSRQDLSRGCVLVARSGWDGNVFGASRSSHRRRPELTNAIVAAGLTLRQARFLVAVMLHLSPAALDAAIRLLETGTDTSRMAVER